MIFENNQLAFQVLDVLQIGSQHIQRVNRNRLFCALSFRHASDAVLHCSGGQELHMQEGSVAFVPEHVDYVRKATVDEMTVFHLELFNYSSRQIEMFVTEKPREIGAKFEAAYQEWMKNRPDRQYRVTAMLYEIFADLYSEYARRTSAYSPLVRQAVRYISRHFTDPSLTVSLIAHDAGVSEVYLRRLFQQELHVSPKAYVTRLRMQYATSLLDSGYYTVSEVSERSGFTDEKYFATVFKRSTGVSPSKYAYSLKE